MSNNLENLKKELKSFAKKVKDFKYNDLTLIAFLLCGAVVFSNNLFSIETQDINAQIKKINISTRNLKQDFKRVRKANDDLLRQSTLELIKLMEQGDHVVKSPWSSWQFGANTFFENQTAAYKGRGDKVGNLIYSRKTEVGNLERFKKNLD